MIDRAIDTLIEKVGFYSAYLVLPLIGVVVYEVFMRYGLNAPTSTRVSTRSDAE